LNPLLPPELMSSELYRVMSHVASIIEVVLPTVPRVFHHRSRATQSYGSSITEGEYLLWSYEVES